MGERMSHDYYETLKGRAEWIAAHRDDSLADLVKDMAVELNALEKRVAELESRARREDSYQYEQREHD